MNDEEKKGKIVSFQSIISVWSYRGLTLSGDKRINMHYSTATSHAENLTHVIYASFCVSEFIVPVYGKGIKLTYFSNLFLSNSS